MSLTAYINEINLQLTRLHKDIQDLQRENRELKDMLTHTHHRCTGRGTCSKKDRKIDELVEDFLESNPDKPEGEDLIQNSNIQDYLKHGR